MSDHSPSWVHPTERKLPAGKGFCLQASPRGPQGQTVPPQVETLSLVETPVEGAERLMVKEGELM